MYRHYTVHCTVQCTCTVYYDCIVGHKRTLVVKMGVTKFEASHKNAILFKNVNAILFKFFLF